MEFVYQLIDHLVSRWSSLLFRCEWFCAQLHDKSTQQNNVCFNSLFDAAENHFHRLSPVSEEYIIPISIRSWFTQKHRKNPFCIVGVNHNSSFGTTFTFIWHFAFIRVLSQVPFAIKVACWSVWLAEKCECLFLQQSDFRVKTICPR